MAVSTIPKNVPYSLVFSLGPQQQLNIHGSTTRYKGVVNMLFRSLSNTGPLSSPLCAIAFFDDRAAYMTFTPLTGTMPSNLSVTTSNGLMVIANNNLTFSCNVTITVLSDVDNVLSFDVSAVST